MKFRFFVLPVVLLFALALGSPASAALSISPASAAQGETPVVTVRVVNTSTSATTNQVEIDLPTGNAVSSLAVEPLAGWSYEYIRANGMITGVTWTSTANGALKTGEFEQFAMIPGQIKSENNALTFKVTQTYSDATNETADLAVNLTATTATTATTAVEEAVSTTTPPINKDRSNAALALSLVALIFAVGALLATLAALARHKD